MTDANSNSPKAETLRVGPVQLSYKVFFGGVVTVCLVALELQRLLMLKVPISTALTGFDAVASALGNIGLVLLLIAGAIVLLMAVAMVALVLAMMVSVVEVSAILLFLLSRLGFWNATLLLVGLLISLRKSINSLRNVEPPLAAPRKGIDTLSRNLDSRSKASRKDLFDGLAIRGTRLNNKLHGIWGHWAKFWQTFITFRLKGVGATILRVTGLLLVLALVIVMGRVIVHHQEAEMYPPDQTWSGRDRPVAAPLEHLLKAGLDHSLATAIAPQLQQGTLTFAKPHPVGTSHLRTISDGKGKIQRSEPVFLIGDFGDWTFVARQEDPSDRLLIRRSNILEVGLFDAPFTEAESPATGTVSTVNAFNDLSFAPSLDIAVTRYPQYGPMPPDPALAARLLEAEKELAVLSSRLAEVTNSTASLPRLNAALGNMSRSFSATYQPAATQEKIDTRLRQDLAAAQTQISNLTEQLATLPRLNTALGTLSAGQVATAQRSATHAQTLSALTREIATLSRQVAQVADETTTLPRINRALATLSAGLTAQDPGTVAPLVDWSDDIAQLQTAQADFAKTVNTHGQTLRRLKTKQTSHWNLLRRDQISIKHSVDALRFFITHLPRDPISTADMPRSIQEALQEGLTTRTSGVLNDLQRRTGQNVTGSCLEHGMRLGFVEFGESKTVGDMRDVQDVVRAVHAELRTKGNLQLLLRGGASYTGAPELNLRLSESRAEWVKHQLLSALSGQTGHPTELERHVLTEHGVQMIAFGMGERLPHPEKSSRAVEVTLCRGAPGTLEARLTQARDASTSLKRQIQTGKENQ